MTEPLTVQQAAQRLLAADEILILCHKNPDGDTVGSASALYHSLLQLGKRTAMLCSDELPARYRYTAAKIFQGEFEPQLVVAVDVASVQLFGEKRDMPRYSRHVNLCIDHHAGNGGYAQGEFEPQLVVAVDVASVQLFGEKRDMPRYSRHVNLCIDHHAGNGGYADFTLLDPHAAATAELLYQVLQEMGVTITPQIADCLYTGIATDTGCFQFASTTARTHQVAAELIEAGAQVEELNTRLFASNARERMAAERIARDHLEYHLDGRCALIYLTRDEIQASGVDPADLEDLTSLPISIEGVQVGVTLRQQPSGSYRISVRTAKGVDACAIARRLGGGGHTRAAGCELLGTLENTKRAILAEVETELGAPKSQEEH